MMRKRIVLAVTGASGAPIAARLIEALSSREELDLALLMSDNARLTFKLECGIDLGSTPESLRRGLTDNFQLKPSAEIYDISDMAAKVSSGSYATGGMVIAPCSMSTLSAVATGVTMNLIHRAASVMLKEKRPLILVPRESPLSPVHLKNMHELCSIGVHIVPATLAFYNRPKRVQDLVDFTCARVLDLAGVPHTLSKRWDGNLEEEHGNTRILGHLE